MAVPVPMSYTDFKLVRSQGRWMDRNPKTGSYWTTEEIAAAANQPVATIQRWMTYESKNLEGRLDTEGNIIPLDDQGKPIVPVKPGFPQLPEKPLEKGEKSVKTPYGQVTQQVDVSQETLDLLKLVDANVKKLLAK